METLYDRLSKDVRYIEGLNACINCGTCTAICPAAEVSDYDPRMLMDSVQEHNEDVLREILSSDTIWRCGECLSCKTRCPKGNTPGSVVQALRNLSVETGLFMKSSQGQKQLALKRMIGEDILRFGYCVYVDQINTGSHPEQGPVWDWFKKNKESLLQRFGASYGKETSGTLRKIPEESLDELRNIFKETGALDRFAQIESLSSDHARELGLEFTEGKDEYFRFLYEQE
ncbi:MAG: 4Fe-4S dicluster domain-containing protein [Bacteroidales bacterium]|nr:4Fe-4S dicluster domain-containing protein [Bacteroidales bacterium]